MQEPTPEEISLVKHAWHLLVNQELIDLTDVIYSDNRIPKDVRLAMAKSALATIENSIEEATEGSRHQVELISSQHRLAAILQQLPYL